MRNFFYVLLFFLLSILLGSIIFYLSLFFVWGQVISVDNGFWIALFTALSLFLGSVKLFFKKEDVKSVGISTFILSSILIALIYFYAIRDNTKLYQYANYPCHEQVITANDDMILLTYAGTSMYLFDQISDKNLAPKAYYDSIKEHMSHTYINTYPAGSKWKIQGLYQSTRYNLTYFLFRSLDDNVSAWLYKRHFDYRNCTPSLYDNKENDFDLYQPHIGEQREKLSLD